MTRDFRNPCHRRRPHLGLAAALALLAGACAASPLQRDEQVLLLRKPARELADGRVELDIQAWVFEFEPRRGSLALFARFLDLDLDELPADQRALFETRTQLFRVDSERNKQLRIRIDGGDDIELPRTRADGRTGRLAIVEPDESGSAQWIDIEVTAPARDPRRFATRIQRVPPQGLSVISDIDDTIKVSQVRDRRALLLNTFTRPFTAVMGMPETYRSLARVANTRFHYVSSSPLQLQPALTAFLDEAGFPQGSMHLREMTSWRSLFTGGPDSQAYKQAAIERLLRDFPQRRFLLVGDSGEHDPEIYAELARKHGDRIAGIAIRDVTGEPADAARWTRTFAGLPAHLWSVFRNGDDWHPDPP